ncbi:hypothetical protein NF700_16700 [Sphingomonadaceae bacterium OTU29MARTA1]|nr:hypothetical protein NF700_16700 [Sphingomonadaceae bacterium OTU29MARTA1]
MKFILACDESGAKGYADQDEQFPGQVGVYAGLLVPEEVLAQTEAVLEAAIAPHRGDNGKLHVTDLEKAAQADLRQRLFEGIQALHLPCFWYAIHVAGYGGHHAMFEGMIADAVKDAAALGGAIQGPMPRAAPGSLHVELFRGLYSHIVAFIEERAPGDVTIEVRTDRVDTPIAKSFREEAERLFDTAPRTSTVSGYDRVEKTVVKRQVTFETHWPEALRIATKVTSLDLRTVNDADPMGVAADVLANSLHHHFRQRGPSEIYEDLNRPGAVQGHPLARSLDTFRNWGGSDISDRLFRHPKAKPLS